MRRSEPAGGRLWEGSFCRAGKKLPPCRVKKARFSPADGGSGLAQGLRTVQRRQSSFEAEALALNGILSSALTTLQTNTSALRVVSHNIANVNTANYARREVNFGTLGAAGLPVGVTIDDIQRASDKFLTQETLGATSSAAMYDSQASAFDQINALLGSPGDGTALTSKLSNINSALGQAALAPTTASSQNSVVSSMRSLASTISTLSDSLGSIATQTDSQISTSVDTCNSAIKQIYDYNVLIKSAKLQGNTDTTYLDQRDSALYTLAQQIDVRVANQSDGSMLVTTQDGVSLVSDSYAQLSYTGGQNGNYSPVMVQSIAPATGAAIGAAQTLDQHLGGGTIRGLIDMRDSTLSNLRNELGAFAQGVAVAFNREHNANSAFPPPDTLSGRQTGLLSGDALNFSGKTTIGLTDSTGTLQHKVDIDFSAQSLSVDGVGVGSFSNTIGDFTNNLNGVLSSLGGSASFAGGEMTLSGGTSGLVVSDTDSANPSSRAGTAFSQFFGLNDLFTSSVPSILNTGASSSDDAGLTASGDITFVLKGPNGEVAKTTTATITPGMTFDQAIDTINTSLTGYAKLTFNTDGSVSTALNSNYKNYSLQVTGDTTARGTTGVSLTELFGIGDNQMRNQAAGFSLTSTIAGDTSQIALARPDFSGVQVVGSGDSSGLLALQSLSTTKEVVSKAGNLASQVTTLGDYASAFYQDIATQSATATASKTTQDDRLTEAKQRLDNETGVSLDEELSNMIIYQQSYSAGARLLTMVGDLYDTLLKVV
jgi:flagellar hook-associated protein 1 FlgK